MSTFDDWPCGPSDCRIRLLGSVGRHAARMAFLLNASMAVARIAESAANQRTGIGSDKSAMATDIDRNLTSRSKWARFFQSYGKWMLLVSIAWVLPHPSLAQSTNFEEDPLLTEAQKGVLRGSQELADKWMALRSSVGPNHPAIRNLRSRLEISADSSNTSLEDAELREAAQELAIRKKYFGPRHPYVRQAQARWDHLSSRIAGNRDPAEARWQQKQRELALWSQWFGVEHPRVRQLRMEIETGLGREALGWVAPEQFDLERVEWRDEIVAMLASAAILGERMGIAHPTVSVLRRRLEQRQQRYLERYGTADWEPARDAGRQEPAPRFVEPQGMGNEERLLEISQQSRLRLEEAQEIADQWLLTPEAQLQQRQRLLERLRSAVEQMVFLQQQASWWIIDDKREQLDQMERRQSSNGNAGTEAEQLDNSVRALRAEIQRLESQAMERQWQEPQLVQRWIRQLLKSDIQ
jgi:hypothetical protein